MYYVNPENISILYGNAAAQQWPGKGRRVPLRPKSGWKNRATGVPVRLPLTFKKIIPHLAFSVNVFSHDNPVCGIEGMAVSCQSRAVLFPIVRPVEKGMLHQRIGR
jgi:hypothetical protein